MSDPQTSDQWIQLAIRKEASARLLVNDRLSCADAVLHVGLAVEAALKAYIMRRERFNIWPPRASRVDLYTHDLQKLMRIAELTIDPTMPQAPSWHILMHWDRLQNYDPNPMPLRVAAQYVEAAFDTNGIVPWLKSL